MRAKVESELEHLQEEGVIRPVEFSQWAASIDLFTKVSDGWLFTALDLSNVYQQVILDEE